MNKKANRVPIETVRDLLISFKDEVFRELNDLRRDIKWDSTILPSLRDGQRSFTTARFPTQGKLNRIPVNAEGFFREATECIPSFDEYNILLLQFIWACRRARETVPSSAERNLTKILINKLRGHAYYAVENEPRNNVINRSPEWGLRIG